MFLELKKCGEGSTNREHKYYLRFETDSDNLRAGVLFPKGCDTQSKDKKKILNPDDRLQAIACAYKSTKYDGFFFSDLDKAKDLAQIFRTYSLPYLLIVEVVGSELDEGTKTKIINALKAGVDYIAVDKDLMAELENKMKGDESEEDNASDNSDDSAS
jgi:hypothetical protein